MKGRDVFGMLRTLGDERIDSGHYFGERISFVDEGLRW